MTPITEHLAIWIPIVANICWFAGNGMWTFFNIRMENRLLREFVSQVSCGRCREDCREEMDRRLARAGA